jgi:RNA polymerase sigma-70 factor (ECF subfamily)
MPEEPDLASVVAAVRANDEDAARELMRRLYPFVAKLVRAHRPPRAAEEDLCQMIFIKVFRNLSSYLGKVPIEHWVSRIAINHCLNQIAFEKARPELRLADLSESEAAVFENLAATTDELAPDRKFAARELVEHLLQALKPAERLVIDMLYLQQRSIAEIQELTGWGAAKIKVRAFRARQKMKKQFSRL